MDFTFVALCFGNRCNRLLDAVSHLSFAVVELGPTPDHHLALLVRVLSCYFVDRVVFRPGQTIHEITRIITK